MAGSVDLAIKITGDTRGAQTALQALVGSLGQLGSAASQAGGSVSRGIGGAVDALGKLGLASIGIQAISQAAMGAGKALGVGLNVELENTRTQMLAFTKDAGATEQILGFLREEANKTPFTFQELSRSVGSLIPAANAAKVPLIELVHQAEVLAASHPEQGLEGAAFALREAAGGDFTSIVERFDLPRQYINQLKEEGVPNIQIVQKAMAAMGYDMDLVAGMSKTLSGQWSTLTDAFDTFRQKASEPIFNVLKDAVAGLNQVISDNQEAFFGLADLIGGGLKNALDQVGAFAGQVMQRLQAGDIQGAFGVILDGINAVGSQMFGAGYQLIQTFAGGILGGIGSVIDAVAEVAASIAAFFIGQSPPPEGPLSEIREGGKRLIEEYAAATGQASLGPIEDVAQKVMSTLTDFKGLQGIGKQVEGQIKLIGEQIETNNREIKAQKMLADAVKESYQKQIDPLQKQLDTLRKTMDLEQKRQQMADRAQDYAMQKARIEAMGDPKRRAELLQALELNRLKQDEVGLRNQAKDIQERLKEKDLSKSEREALNLQLEAVRLQQEEAGLIDKSALAKIVGEEKRVEFARQARDVEQGITNLQREQEAMDLEGKIEGIKTQMTEALQPHEEMVKLFQKDNELLSLQQDQWKALKTDIQAAADAVKPESGGGKGGKGAAGAAPAGGFDLKKMLAGMTGGMDEATRKAGQQAAQGLVDGFNGWFKANAGKLIGAGIGAVLGGIALGPLGAIVGGKLGLEIATKLGEKAPLIEDEVRDGIFPRLVTAVNQFASGNWQFALNTLGTMFRDFIEPHIQPTLDNLGKLKDAIAKWIGDQVEPLKNTFMQWGAAALAWVTTGIESISTEAPKFLDAVFKWIADNGENFGKEFAKLGVQSLAWVAAGILLLNVELLKLIAAVAKWVTVDGGALKIAEATVALGKGVIAGIVEGVSDLASALGSAIADQLRKLKVDVGPFHVSAHGVKIDLPGGGSVGGGGGEDNGSNAPGSGAGLGGGRAFGGDVRSGASYLVGERGPELFLPRQSGQVVSNRDLVAALAGANTGTTINVTYNGDGSPDDPDKVRRFVAYLKFELERQQGGLAMSGAY